MTTPTDKAADINRRIVHFPEYRGLALSVYTGPLCGSDRDQTPMEQLVIAQDNRITALEAERDALAAEVERLQAIVGKLPKVWRLNDAGELAQDAPVAPPFEVFIHTCGAIKRYWILGIGSKTMNLSIANGRYLEAAQCYSTREAAEAARGE